MEAANKMGNKTIIRTNVNNITRLKDGSFSYTEDLVWSKWIPDTNSQPSPFVKVIQPHLSDDLDTSDSTGKVERTGNKPRDKESI